RGPAAGGTGRAGRGRAVRPRLADQVGRAPGRLRGPDLGVQRRGRRARGLRGRILPAPGSAQPRTGQPRPRPGRGRSAQTGGAADLSRGGAAQPGDRAVPPRRLRRSRSLPDVQVPRRLRDSWFRIRPAATRGGNPSDGGEMSNAWSERVLLTPGPVSTGAATRQAMLRDFSPNEPDLLALTAEMRERLVGLVNGGDRYVCVPLQGVGNTANEATIGTLVPRERRLLIIANGFYGERLKQIAGAIGVPFTALDLPWTEPVTGEQLDEALAADPAISHVVVCHVDTGTGLLNPLEPLAEVAKRRGVALIVDAIASCGGLPIDARALDLEAVVVSPNKWLEGVPGIGLVVAKRAALEAAAGRAHSFCLDLHRQWRSLEHDGRWRFTPATQATAALVAALRQHEAEGQAARLERVRRNWRCLVEGLRALGFATYLRDEV